MKLLEIVLLATATYALKLEQHLPPTLEEQQMIEVEELDAPTLVMVERIVCPAAYPKSCKKNGRDWCCKN